MIHFYILRAYFVTTDGSANAASILRIWLIEISCSSQWTPKQCKCNILEWNSAPLLGFCCFMIREALVILWTLLKPKSFFLARMFAVFMRHWEQHVVLWKNVISAQIVVKNQQWCQLSIVYLRFSVNVQSMSRTTQNFLMFFTLHI